MVWFVSTWIESEYLWLPITEFSRPTFSTSKLFSCSVLSNFCCLQGFHFNFFCIMPHQTMVGKIRNPYDGFKDVEDSLPGTSNLQAWTSNGSWWVHSNFVIRVPPKISTNFVTTFLTPEGGVPINAPLSINVRTCLFSMHDEIFAQPRNTYCNIFFPIVISDNERCSIIVRLVSANLYIVDMDNFLEVFMLGIVVKR